MCPSSSCHRKRDAVLTTEQSDLTPTPPSHSTKPWASSPSPSSPTPLSASPRTSSASLPEFLCASSPSALRRRVRQWAGTQGSVSGQCLGRSTVDGDVRWDGGWYVAFAPCLAVPGSAAASLVCAWLESVVGIELACHVREYSLGPGRWTDFGAGFVSLSHAELWRYVHIAKSND